MTVTVKRFILHNIQSGNEFQRQFFFVCFFLEKCTFSVNVLMNIRALNICANAKKFFSLVNTQLVELLEKPSAGRNNLILFYFLT